MMASTLEGCVFIAGLTYAIEALDVGRVVHTLTWRGGIFPIELHFGRGAVFLSRDGIPEGAAALRFKFERVHARLFPIGELFTRSRQTLA